MATNHVSIITNRPLPINAFCCKRGYMCVLVTVGAGPDPRNYGGRRFPVTADQHRDST